MNFRLSKERRNACLPGDQEEGPRSAESQWTVTASVRTAARTDVGSVVQPLGEAASNKAGTANWTGCQLDYEI